MLISNFTKYFIFCVIFSVTLLSLFYNLNYFRLKSSFKNFVQSKSSDLKYILIWTSSINTDPIKYLGEGTTTFRSRRCSFTNCYVSSNKQLLKDITDFDVLLFHGSELQNEASSLPQSRSPHQKYVFASMESSANYPVCNQMYNNYFNWTWTYRLNSDEYYGYLSIRDKDGKVLGPKEEMHWEKVEKMMPINVTLKEKLRTKKIAAAWFVSHCGARSGRDFIAKRLLNELAKYGMQVDIYGRCGKKKCPRGNMTECLRKLETDYYFYLSFENTIADDYVTEKLLHALNHYAVPVVYGGANYTRFMPDGIYLSARLTGSHVRKLAKKMVNIINDKQKYYEFFKWHNHYSYHDLTASRDTDPYCKLCALVNDKEQFSRTSVYEDFVHWWSPHHKYNAGEISCCDFVLNEKIKFLIKYRHSINMTDSMETRPSCRNKYLRSTAALGLSLLMFLKLICIY